MAHPAHKWMKRRRGGAVEGSNPPPSRLDRPGKIGILKTGASDPGHIEKPTGLKSGGRARRDDGGSVSQRYNPPAQDDDAVMRQMHQEDLDAARKEPSATDYQGNATVGAKHGGRLTTSVRRSAESKGDAMPGGRFPIRNAKDLSNAKHDFGRANDKPAVRRFIDKRAKALGKPAMGES
jgi:hypothetical protein